MTPLSYTCTTCGLLICDAVDASCSKRLMASAVSYALALKVTNEGLLGQAINNLAQPLLLLSGTLLPVALAPLWLQRIADWNPFGWAVTGMRALYAGHLGEPLIWRSVVVMGVLTVLAFAWSARLFARTQR